MATLYLIPTTLAADTIDHIPAVTKQVLQETKVLVVERIRTARRFLRSLDASFPIDEKTFIELDKHHVQGTIERVVKIVESNVSIGFLSEAGSPCIADPGARIVNIAREAGYLIRPLSGPSSIMLGLMASGMNGQQFTFYGYLPIKKNELAEKLKIISNQAMKQGDTHLFIETPYRNVSLLTQIIKNVDRKLFLSVGIELTGLKEQVITKPIAKWAGTELGKQPCIFAIGKLVA